MDFRLLAAFSSDPELFYAYRNVNYEFVKWYYMDKKAPEYEAALSLYHTLRGSITANFGNEVMTSLLACEEDWDAVDSAIAKELMENEAEKAGADTDEAP